MSYYTNKSDFLKIENIYFFSFIIYFSHSLFYFFLLNKEQSIYFRVKYFLGGSQQKTLLSIG